MSSASSSRRSPLARRDRPLGSPTAYGDRRARQARRVVPTAVPSEAMGVIVARCQSPPFVVTPVLPLFPADLPKGHTMIVVTTPTGNVGSGVAQALLEAGREVRVVVRDPSRLSASVRQGAEVVVGSHGDPDVLEEAFAGADDVFWLVPPLFTAPDVVGYYRDFARAAAGAITARRVRRVVAVTSLGRQVAAQRAMAAGNLSAAFAMDEVLEATGVAYRGLSMPFFMDNLLSQVTAIAGAGIVSLPNAADRPLATVATADIAAAATTALLDRGWAGQQAVPVVGPDDLTPVQMTQVAAEVLDRPLTFVPATLQDYRSTMSGYGASSGFAAALVAMTAAQNDGIYDPEVAAVRNTGTGVGATSFRRWCEQVLAPAVRTAEETAQARTRPPPP